MKSFKAALDANKKTEKPAAKKSSMPTIKASSLTETINSFVAAQKKEKEAKAEKDFTGAEIIEFAREAQDKDAFAGNFNKSYEVVGDDNSVKFITKDQFSLNPDDEDDIKKVLGDGSLLTETVSVTLKAEVFENDELQKELMNLLGDKFAEFFEVSSKLKVVAGFDQKVYGAVKPQNIGLIRSLVKQTKPSVR